MKTKHAPKTKFVPKYRELSKQELERINEKIKDGFLSGMIDGEEATQILFNLITTRKFND